MNLGKREGWKGTRRNGGSGTVIEVNCMRDKIVREDIVNICVTTTIFSFSFSSLSWILGNGQNDV